VGQLLAELIVTGASSEPLDRMSIERFGTAAVSDELLESACIRTYAHQYASGWSARVGDPEPVTRR